MWTTLHIDLFDTEVVFCVKKREEFLDLLQQLPLYLDDERVYDERCRIPLAHREGFTANFGDVQIVAVSYSDVVIMHESLHAALNICHAKGITDDETLCYLLGYIYTHIKDFSQGKRARKSPKRRNARTPTRARKEVS